MIVLGSSVLDVANIRQTIHLLHIQRSTANIGRCTLVTVNCLLFCLLYDFSTGIVNNAANTL